MFRWLARGRLPVFAVGLIGGAGLALWFYCLGIPTFLFDERNERPYTIEFVSDLNSVEAAGRYPELERSEWRFFSVWGGKLISDYKAEDITGYVPDFFEFPALSDKFTPIITIEGWSFENVSFAYKFANQIIEKNNGNGMIADNLIIIEGPKDKPKEILPDVEPTIRDFD